MVYEFITVGRPNFGRVAQLNFVATPFDISAHDET